MWFYYQPATGIIVGKDARLVAFSGIQDYICGGDDGIQACMAELGVLLSKETGFHQYDVYGDDLVVPSCDSTGFSPSCGCGGANIPWHEPS
ncbi:hypothetical protein OIU77_017138 [Salix suchowensis]|uniref:Uncharacterized protein n=1 Tax=Salix suchowensis TaxID=1278906 RepID=A0ABQ8ZMR0_9ROSI|nr:hypothetical protein OIU77_017138 [Salix suchowensis]